MVIVPWRGGCPFRERSLEWLKVRLDVTVAECLEGPWVKATAVNPAVARADSDIVIVHDADVWTDGLEQAIQAVRDGAAWAVPHTMVRRLTETASDAFRVGAPPEGLELTEPEYRGVWGGGILVAPKATLVDVPLDPRFVGWGQEDTSHAIALWCLAGPGWRGPADLWHMWHPEPQRQNRTKGNPDGVALWRRYKQARETPSRMRALIEEARLVADDAFEPAGHDRP